MYSSSAWHMYREKTYLVSGLIQYRQSLFDFVQTYTCIVVGDYNYKRT